MIQPAGWPEGVMEEMDLLHHAEVYLRDQLPQCKSREEARALYDACCILLISMVLVSELYVLAGRA